MRPLVEESLFGAERPTVVTVTAEVNPDDEVHNPPLVAMFVQCVAVVLVESHSPVRIAQAVQREEPQVWPLTKRLLMMMTQQPAADPIAMLVRTYEQ